MYVIPSKESSQESRRLECLNWPDQFPYAPEVSFKAWHNGKSLFLTFEVEEQSVRAEENVPGNFVYKDSCVEFFVKPSADDPHYYNFEFNAIGNPFLAYRTGRQDPEYPSKDILSLIRTESSLGSEPFSEKPCDGKWTLRIEIPVSALWHSGLETWSGMKATANFYKCGDGLKVPHYITWAPIKTANPDYHRPEFFAPVEFE